jgi:hypothetical protein
MEELKRTFSKYVDFQPLAEAYKAAKVTTQSELILASVGIVRCRSGSGSCRPSRKWRLSWAARSEAP